MVNEPSLPILQYKTSFFTVYNKQTKNEDSVHGERTLVTHPKNIKTRFLAVCKNNEESNMEPNL